ncbi:YjjG family noncanonical pyrimidine nucleotidase [Staphylococcus kloosii]|uniref:YjjG family noncanonical pyrimidine nucleotidase n=1 Tax=Staphylococcus kloosii TaxID=29384 RepID=UPI0028A3C81B|nr:YjjG family noncanonical pyrimidine nucleotidase [Staphylococcus kloosii]MDT3958836.1 YjjG family noncanonical pyrimidine nucleotidase [Staphylococcus kloosii]
MKEGTILFDFDDTLVDFKAAETYAFYKLIDCYNFNASPQDFNFFTKVNQQHWQDFQKGELSKDEVLSQRFERFFESYNINVDGQQADSIFRDALANAPLTYFDNMLNTLKELSRKFDLYIVTNGVLETQERRIAKFALKDLFDGVFVSEQTGYQKPMPEFFDYVFDKIGECRRSNTMIVGDSLSSDILGGINANIKTCWFNPRHQINDTNIEANVTINHFEELLVTI